MCFESVPFRLFLLVSSFSFVSSVLVRFVSLLDKVTAQPKASIFFYCAPFDKNFDSQALYLGVNLVSIKRWKQKPRALAGTAPGTAEKPLSFRTEHRTNTPTTTPDLMSRWVAAPSSNSVDSLIVYGPTFIHNHYHSSFHLKHKISFALTPKTEDEIVPGILS